MSEIDKTKTGAELIAEERKRQIEQEGWTAKHDDSHGPMVLAIAGAAYALDCAAIYSEFGEHWKKKFKEYADQVWPFDEEWFKPTTDPIRQLVKAGALIAAEIDRIQRGSNG